MEGCVVTQALSASHLSSAETRCERHATAFSIQYSWCNPPRIALLRRTCPAGRRWRWPRIGGDGRIGSGTPGPRLAWTLARL